MDPKRKPLALAVWAVSQLPPIAKHGSSGAIRHRALDAIMTLAHDSITVVPKIAWCDERGQDHDIELDPPIPCDICCGMEAREEIDKYITVPDNRVDYWLNDDLFDSFFPKLLDEYEASISAYKKWDGGTVLRGEMEEHKECLEAFAPQFGSDTDRKRFARLSKRHAALVRGRRFCRMTAGGDEQSDRVTLNVIHFRDSTLEIRCYRGSSPISVFARYLDQTNSRVEDHRLSNLQILFPDLDVADRKKRKRGDAE